MEKRDHRNWPVPFSIEFVTCNRATGSGGELVKLSNVVLYKNQKAAGGPAKPGRPEGTQAPAKNPNHWANATRNIYLLDSNQIRKINIRLILKLNNQSILY